MADMSQITGLTETLQRLEQMINAVDQKSNNIASSVDAAASMLRANVDSVNDMNRSVERLRLETAAEIGATGRISTIEAKLGESYDSLVAGVQALQTILEDKLQTIGKLALSNDDKMVKYEQQFRLRETSIDNLKQDITAKTARLEGAISGAYNQMQSQANSAQGSNVGQSKTPLDSEKKFDQMPKVSGDEPAAELAEWKRKISVLIESSIPGSITTLEWAEKTDRRDNLGCNSHRKEFPAAHKLNQQLYSFMMLKMGGRGDTAMRKIDCRMGLEAWRVVWETVGKKDAQSLHEEFVKLTNVPPQEKLSTLTSFITQWEVRLDEMRAIDPTNYLVGPMHKLTILKGMLPKELNKWVTDEQNYGRLMTYDELRDLVTLKSNQAYDRQTGGAPDIMNVESAEPLISTEDAMEQRYTDEECQQWLLEPEGAIYHLEHPEDIQINRAALSLVSKGKGGKIGGKGFGFKGKGKGKGYQCKPGKGYDNGKEKGKGKDRFVRGKCNKGKGFQGHCHKCGEWGHTQWECPHNTGKSVNALEQQQQFGMVWYLTDTKLECPPCKPVVEARDPIDLDKNSWINVVGGDRMREVESTRGKASTKNKFEGISEDEEMINEADEFPDIKNALTSMHKSKPKVAGKRSPMKFSPEVEKAARFIESKKKGNKNSEAAQKTGESTQDLILSQVENIMKSDKVSEYAGQDINLL